MTPESRLGVFKQIGDVPAARRFEEFAAAYDGQNTWGSYRETIGLSSRMSEDWTRFSRRWMDHMEGIGRHHALARPDDVESWSGDLLERFSRDRAYQHWNVIEGFYEWLKWHTEHPHRYNPFHMAAAVKGSSAHEIWGRKMEKSHD